MQKNPVHLWKTVPNGQGYSEEQHALDSQGHKQALETSVELSDDDLIWVCGGALSNGPLNLRLGPLSLGL